MTRIENTPGGRLAAARLGDAEGNIDAALQAVDAPYRLGHFYDYVDVAAAGLRYDYRIDADYHVALVGRLAGIAAAAFLLGIETDRAERTEEKAPTGPRCADCGDPIETWHHVLLCDRCLDAQRARDLDADDYVLVRRSHNNGHIYIDSNLDGNRRHTDATALNLDPRTETLERLDLLQEADPHRDKPDAPPPRNRIDETADRSEALDLARDLVGTAAAPPRYSIPSDVAPGAERHLRRDGFHAVRVAAVVAGSRFVWDLVLDSIDEQGRFSYRLVPLEPSSREV